MPPPLAGISLTAFLERLPGNRQTAKISGLTPSQRLLSGLDTLHALPDDGLAAMLGLQQHRRRSLQSRIDAMTPQPGVSASCSCLSPVTSRSHRDAAKSANPCPPPRLLQHSGRWRKMDAASDSMQEAVNMVNLAWYLRPALPLLKSLEIVDDGVHFTTVLNAPGGGILDVSSLLVGQLFASANQTPRPDAGGRALSLEWRAGVTLAAGQTARQARWLRWPCR